MTSEQWQRVEQLLHEALARNASEREGFVSEACGDDDSLKRELQSLLDSHQRAAGFIETPALEVAAKAMAGDYLTAPVGLEIGHFRIESLLGLGGMGAVYLAHDTRLDRRIALKLLPPEFTEDTERVARFEQEAKSASALNHPNIVTIHEIGHDHDVQYIATEYIDGETLKQRIKNGPVKLREAIEITVQVASALSAAHEAGIVHRDIKLDNIMLRPDGYVKVLDFGLAKLTEKRSVQRFPGNSEDMTLDVKTTPGLVMGTINYMSPEQAQAKPVDGRSDIFSLGVVLYEIVTGRPPFEGANMAEVLAAIFSKDPPPLARYLRDAPAELERIVTKALQKDREHRYQNAKDLMIDLKNLGLELEVDAKLKRAESVESAIPHPVMTRSTMNAAAPASRSTALQAILEPIGGAVPLDSKFYVVRPTDEKFAVALSRQDSIVLVKGARQVGKTSLLARGLQQARDEGSLVVLTDLQNFSASDLESLERLLVSFAEVFADQLDLDVYPKDVWKTERSPSVNFEQYLRRQVLAKSSAQIVWALDEVDRLFTCDFGSEVFGLFRSWHNKRALDPTGPWRRLTLAIAYATEAHLFITDLNQSPFNVGTRLQLEDFTFEQVDELNQRYCSPLHDKAEVARFFRLVGGHPYLVRRGLYELVSEGIDLPSLESSADHDEGPFGDHLRRILVSLSQDKVLSEAVSDVLQGRACASLDNFYRLRGGGLMLGDSPREARLRCQLYTSYLEKHLL